MNPETSNYGILIAAFASILGAVLGGVVTVLLNSHLNKRFKKTIERLESEASDLKLELRSEKERVDNIRVALQRQTIVENHRQYVLLCGPSNVGKTSLVRRLHSPWDRLGTKRTDTPKISEVPVIKIPVDELKEHPALKTIKIKTKRDVSLLLYDFPGDPNLQEKIVDILVQETTNSIYGVVLVFMFDASELGNISDDTRKYYTGDLFRRLRFLQSHQIDIVRIILVFNKFDKLKKNFPDASINDLIDRCCRGFAPLLEPIHGAVDGEKVCALASILEVTNKENEDMGASLIRGEAARSIVKRLDPERLKEVITQNAVDVEMNHFIQQ
jgi:GTP-binding protein EngB required for normal cell division